MIPFEKLKKNFLKFANKEIVLKKLIRCKSELNSKPKISYKEIVLKNCIIKREKARFDYSETGVSSESKLVIIRLLDDTKFSIGDKIIFEEIEYSIESPPYIRDRLEGFKTIQVELKYVGIQN
jgi:hypothetical protein